MPIVYVNIQQTQMLINIQQKAHLQYETHICCGLLWLFFLCGLNIEENNDRQHNSLWCFLGLVLYGFNRLLLLQRLGILAQTHLCLVYLQQHHSSVNGQKANCTLLIMLHIPTADPFTCFTTYAATVSPTNSRLLPHVHHMNIKKMDRGNI